MRTTTEIKAFAYPVRLKDQRSGEQIQDTIVIPKEWLQLCGSEGLNIQSLEQKGIRAMRQPRIAKRLRPLYEDFDFYSFSGLGSFRNCSMSVQEKYVIQQENSRDK